MNQVLHEAIARKSPERVWFSGSTAGVKGRGVCYDRDFVTTTTGQTISDPWEKRAKTVEHPTISNGQFFAGVIAHSFAAKTGGQWIYIYEPGSVCEIQVDEAVTGGVSVVGCYANYVDAGNASASALIGQFGGEGIARAGVGSALVLETDSTAAAGTTVLAYLLDGRDGPQTGLLEYRVLVAGANTSFLVGGTTEFGTATLAQAATLTLADGTRPGLRKTFCQTGTTTTSGIVITATTGLEYDADSNVLQDQMLIGATNGNLVFTAAAQVATANPHVDLVWTPAGWRPFSFYLFTISGHGS